MKLNATPEMIPFLNLRSAVLHPFAPPNRRPAITRCSRGLKMAVRHHRL
jgi:hypothetical protein